MPGNLAALLLWSLTQTVGASEVVPPAAHIGVFQQCDDKVTALSSEDLNKHIPTAQCEDLDVDRMKELGVEDCSKLRNTLGRLVLEFHCGETVAKQVQEACTVSGDPATLSEDCVTKVSEGVKEWSPSDAFQPFGEETPEGTEEVIALVVACTEGVDKAVQSLEDDGPFDAWCKGAGGELSVDNLKAMGVSHDHCKEQTVKLFKADMTFMCARPPADVEAADVTLDLLKKHVEQVIKHMQDEVSGEDSHFQEEADEIMSQPAAERLRLYQVVAKGWPTKVHGVSLKSVAVPGAALATMMVAVVFTWGLRRSHLRTVDLGDEMLEHTNSEESPE